MHLRPALAVLAGSAVLALSGCSGFGFGSFNSLVYRPDVSQGNLITREMTDQLRTGMTKAQVRSLLGEPLIESLLRRSRWDYTYYLNPRRGDVQLRHLTVVFDDEDRLVRVEGSKLPTEKQADSMILGYDTDFVPEPVPEKKDAAPAAPEKPAGQPKAESDPAS